MPINRIESARTARVARGLAGGALMGLANLVPGISGGTMLLAVGVYPQVIEAIAKLTTLRPDRDGLTLLASVAGSAALLVLVLAGTVRDLVIDHRWVMYSLFLGSTLGGVPVLWGLIGRPTARCWLGAACGLALMFATAAVPAGPAVEGASPAPALFLAGAGAFAAMLLPGLSGSYLLVLSGQYVPILTAVDTLKGTLLEPDGSRWPAVIDAARVLAPFAVGALVALVSISSLIRWLLNSQRSLTLGFLLGLLAGAVLGLWPFETESGGLSMPGFAQGGAALCLAVIGFLVTKLVARLGNGDADA